MNLITNCNQAMNTIKKLDPYAAALREIGIEDPIEPFDKILMNTKDQLEKQMKRTADHLRFINAYYRDPLNRLMTKFLDPSGLSYSMYLDFYYGTTIQLQLSCDSLREVVPVLRLLAHEGLAIHDRPQKGGSESSKIWQLLPRGMTYDYFDTPRLGVCVSAKRCERVKVGTKEVDVYETVCDWGSADTAMLKG